jgi:hypothetical protein
MRDKKIRILLFICSAIFLGDSPQAAQTAFIKKLISEKERIEECYCQMYEGMVDKNEDIFHSCPFSLQRPRSR